MNYLTNILFEIEQLPYYGIIEGAMTDDIATLISKNSPIELPNAYLEFLRIMGNRVPFLRGLDYQLACLEELNQIGRYMVLEHHHSLKLKETDFIFLMSQGSAFAFFNLLEGENPPVYGFIENQKPDNFKIITPTFTDFLERKFRKNNPFGIIPIKKENQTQC